jgi:hypothetical protein
LRLFARCIERLARVVELLHEPLEGLEHDEQRSVVAVAAAAHVARLRRRDSRADRHEGAPRRVGGDDEAELDEQVPYEVARLEQ